MAAIETDGLRNPRDFRVVRHHEREAWAVEFLCDKGLRYRTSFTSYRFEADWWVSGVKIYGWSISGRPYRADTPFEQEDFVLAIHEAAAQPVMSEQQKRAEEYRRKQFQKPLVA